MQTQIQNFTLHQNQVLKMYNVEKYIRVGFGMVRSIYTYLRLDIPS